MSNLRELSRAKVIASGLALLCALAGSPGCETPRESGEEEREEVETSPGATPERSKSGSRSTGIQWGVE